MSRRNRREARRGRTLAVWLALALPGAAQAQQVLVQANVADDTLKTTFGPNRRYFGHGYVGYGQVGGPAGPGAAVRYGHYSSELRLGGRLKVRLNQTLAVHTDLAYAFQRFELAQQAAKTIPSPALHERETFSLHQVAADAGLRLNYGRRGNTVGRYLDLLAGGSWVAASSHSTSEVPGPGVASREVTEHGLAYFRRWSGSTSARLGFDRYALTARYRLTPTFTAAYAGWPELPRWVFGVELGIF
ncbi:MAG: hypothetical protein M3Y54_01040 [Bacteroidota bacterium]|nr:hypothetical protein [Bacteroidota bacterium]